MKFKVSDSKDIKSVQSEHYNYLFNKKNGLFVRWGKTQDEDPQFSPIGPEILDIEITTKCSGIRGKLCPYCYKSNTAIGKNMSFETFKQVIDKVNCNNQLTQIAFGLGSTGEENPDVWKMAEWVRNERGIIPNGTVADISDGTADRIAKYFGACAISYHDDKDICYDSIKKLTDRDMTQVNMHFVLSENSYQDALSVMRDMKTDSRLAKMNAIVLLSLKKKGRAANSNDKPISQENYNHLINFAFENDIKFGCDSCGSTKFLKYVESHPDKDDLTDCVEPCESLRGSLYVNVDGIMFPCSFMESVFNWKSGISVINAPKFLSDVWNSKASIKWRMTLIANKCECPSYEI